MFANLWAVRNFMVKTPLNAALVKNLYFGQYKLLILLPHPFTEVHFSEPFPRVSN
jgi:hypothetical protein